MSWECQGNSSLLWSVWMYGLYGNLQTYCRFPYRSHECKATSRTLNRMGFHISRTIWQLSVVFFRFLLVFCEKTPVIFQLKTIHWWCFWPFFENSLTFLRTNFGHGYCNSSAGVVWCFVRTVCSVSDRNNTAITERRRPGDRQIVLYHLR